MSKKFMVAVDGSEHGWKALDLATNMASNSDAELVIVHVVPYEPLPEGLGHFAEMEGLSVEELRSRYLQDKAIGDRIATEAEARARKNGLAQVTTQVAEGNPANQIVELAKSEGTEMVFLGSRGLGDIKGLLMGSVSHKVMNLAPCTCVAVK
jgi:nucleotide-binding universal stress UspA family protein